jgi:hypothetical protein
MQPGYLLTKKSAIWVGEKHLLLQSVIATVLNKAIAIAADVTGSLVHLVKE